MVVTVETAFEKELWKTGGLYFLDLLNRQRYIERIDSDGMSYSLWGFDGVCDRVWGKNKHMQLFYEQGCPVW